VANVGGSVGAGLLETTLQEWKRTFDLNLFHAVVATRAVVPHMQEGGGGSVLIVSSISGWKPVSGRAQYATAKAAEIHLAASLARELAPQRIRVNSLSPGSVLLEGGAWARFRDREPDAFGRFAREELPWGRLASPEEIVDVAAFLLSDRARWINGANIPVDGAQRSPAAW
jgi:3-oxoacyl-[acyl-carrier protein] reductase